MNESRLNEASSPAISFRTELIRRPAASPIRDAADPTADSNADADAVRFSTEPEFVRFSTEPDAERVAAGSVL
jgi:hypothetical protein